jgi:cytochrome c biogenesis protein CcmG, thiol:disulfide interchange protein DsbE
MRLFLLIIIYVITSQQVFAQNDLPLVTIKTLAGEQRPFNKLVSSNSDTIIIVSLWATWCIPCLQELESINDQYADWQKEKPLRVVAISVDDARTSARVRSFAAGKGWDFEIYLDINSDLKRALNVNDVPHLLLVKNGKIVYQQNGYVPGNEVELFEKIKTL